MNTGVVRWLQAANSRCHDITVPRTGHHYSTVYEMFWDLGMNTDEEMGHVTPSEPRT
jgi:hypothetical protein